MERYTKRIICICLCCLIVTLNIRVARAEAVPDVMCGSATVADCVMSYYAMSGAAVANTDWINTLYNDLGSSFGTIYDFAENGMLTLNGDGTWQATTALETAIENAPAYQSLGLDQVFNVTSAEVAAGGGLAAASGGSILGGALGCTASVGVLPLLGGVTAAYWGGIGIGTITAHLLGLYEKPITNGININYTDPINLVTSKKGIILDSRNGYRITYSENAELYYVQVGNYIGTLYFLSGTGTGSNNTVKLIVSDSSINNGEPFIFANQNFYAQKYIGNNASLTPVNKFMPILLRFDNQNQFNDYVNKLNNNLVVLPNPISPDIIGSEGNQVGSYDPNTGEYSVPNLKPQIDPGTQSGIPLSLNDWLNFANSVNNNNSQTNPLPDNSALFDNLVDLIKKAVPDPNPNPNPDPYTPPNPTPSPDPDYDPNPDNTNQPDYESEREGQTEPVPDSIPTGAPWITDGLLDKFPFCIPKDMIDMVKNFSSGTRQAPYISWRFNPPNTPVDYTFNLDLSDFEEVAALLRLLELGVFIVGLAFATRYLIGAT